MKIYLAMLLALVFFNGCKFERKAKYKECMEAGTINLYGRNLAPKFCDCMAKGLINGGSPFALGNSCAKPILQKMSSQNQ